MKILYTFLLCLALVPSLFAQTAADCTIATAEPLANVFTQIGTDQPYTAGINTTYCANSESPFGAEAVGNISFSEDITYPFSIEITDLATGTVTVLANFGDNLDILGNQLYFIEVIPAFAGNGDVLITPLNTTANFIGPQTINVDVDPNLPVTWQQPLSYIVANKQVTFNWSVTDQVNVSDYSLQKSTGGTWVDVVTQPARQGRSAEVSYRATDLHGVEDAHYRVKQTDFDGQFSYSNIIVVPGAGLATELSFFPNPAREVINFTSPVAISGLRLLNMAGRPVRELYNQGTNGTMSLVDLPAGIYLLEVTHANGERITRRVLHK